MIMKKACSMMLAAALAVTSLGAVAAFAEEEVSNELTVAVGYSSPHLTRL